LQSTEAELDRLRAANKVIDVKGVLAAVTAAIRRYRQMVTDLGNAPIDIPRAREMIRGIVDRIPVRPGADGVPVAQLALNKEMPLAHAAGAASQVDVVAGA
jgi:hypothetical protein